MTVLAVLAEASRQLVAQLKLSVAEAKIEAQVLLRAALGGVSRAWLMTHLEQALTSVQAVKLQALLQRRLQGEPVAYLLGSREFYGLELEVNPAVLIPRPDTEVLVDAALKRIPEDRPCRVLDLGTGSGAIAVAIARQRPLTCVLAIDNSPAALMVAARNAKALDAVNVTLLESDWFAALGGMVFDAIVGNPPYIAADDPHLGLGDLRFEPPRALVAGVDGMEDIRHIVTQAPTHLVAGGWLLLEHGYDQAGHVARLFYSAGFEAVSAVADLAGIPRVTLGRKPNLTGAS